MASNQLLADLMSFVTSIYGFGKPVIVLELIFFIIVAQSMKGGGTAKDVGQAILFYVLEGLALFLMTLGALPTVMAVVGPQSFEPDLYLALMLVFATGGILFLWVDQHLRALPATAKAIPSSVFQVIIKTVGYLFVVFSALSIAMAIANAGGQTEDWWVVPLVSLAYGTLICFLTNPNVQEALWTDGTTKKRKK